MATVEAAGGDANELGSAYAAEHGLRVVVGDAADAWYGHGTVPIRFEIPESRMPMIPNDCDSEQDGRSGEGNDGQCRTCGKPAVGATCAACDALLDGIRDGKWLDEQVFPPSDWGPWRLRPEELVLVHMVKPAYVYEVDLSSCVDSAEVLDWVAQINRKSWADHRVVAGLVAALDDVLNLQRNLCTGGASREITRDDIAELVRRAVERWPQVLMSRT